MQVPVAQAITVVQYGGCIIGGQHQVVAAQLADPADGLPRIFGGVEGADVFFAALDKIVGELSVEILVGVGLKRQPRLAVRGCRQLGPFVEDVIEQLAVVAGDVFDEGHVLVAALDLEAAQPHVDERAQVVALVVVLHGQHMLVMCHDAPLTVFHLIRQPAGLRAIAPVGASTGVGVADVTLPAVGHAQRAVYEKLQQAAIGVDHISDGGDLRQGEFAREHQLRQTGVLKEAGFFGGSNVGLG